MKATPAQIRRLGIDRAQWRFMRAAGFHVTDRGVKDAPAYLKTPDHLVQWQRGNLMMCMARTDVPTIKSFTNHLINQVYHQTVRAARAPYPFGDQPCFPTTNEEVK